MNDMPILTYPEKCDYLPYLSRSLAGLGYKSTFTYGGDVDFANIRSYLVDGGFTSIRSSEDYPVSERTGKWGIPDHTMFNRFYDEVMQEKGPYMKVFLTLSNHEPFIIPGKPKFGDDDLGNKFLSSAYYADSCLGSFVQKLKASPVWDSLLIVMVADHGARLPDYSEMYEPRKYHIPLLWAGGAISRDSVVSKLGSQADLAVTLLHQLNLPTGDYVLGKDLLSPSSRSFAFYSYKNGIGMLTDTSGFGIDFTSGKLNFSDGNSSEQSLDYAKSLQQYAFDNYLKLGPKTGNQGGK